MKMNRLIIGLLLLFLPCWVVGQEMNQVASLTDLEGDYQPIGKAKIYGKLFVKRARADTVRIIICDSSLFRNNDDKGEFLLYQYGDRFLIYAENAKGELFYNATDEVITISFQKSAGVEPDIFSWQKTKPEIGKVSVFPNPTSDWVQIQAESLQSVDIYDSSGRRLLSLMANDSEQMQIDLRRFKSGVYVFQIHQTDCVKTVRVVVQ